MSIRVDSLLVITGEGKDKQIDLHTLSHNSEVYVTYAIGEGLQQAKHVTLRELLESYSKVIGTPANVVIGSRISYHLKE